MQIYRELVKQETAHGYCVSLVKYNDKVGLEAGFTLATFDSAEARDTYASDLAEILGLPLETEMTWPLGLGEDE